MSDELQVVIGADATIRCLYDEALDLGQLGRLRISRGSHVEPDQLGGWQADMSPVDGPVLGPYSLRSQALAAERSWLQRNWLSAGHQQ